MANVTVNDNTKYVELGTLCSGDYFILSGDLYIIRDENYDLFDCFNLSDNEISREIDRETKVLPIPSEKIKIKVEI